MNGEEASSEPAHNIRGPHRVDSLLQCWNCREGKHLSSWDRTTVAPELYRPRRSVTFTQPREALLMLSHKALSTATNTSTQGWWLERGLGKRQRPPRKLGHTRAKLGHTRATMNEHSWNRFIHTTSGNRPWESLSWFGKLCRIVESPFDIQYKEGERPHLYCQV